ncbi:rhamnogalacturonan lyase [Micromonospora sp. NPDC050417]|uniref:rhamnogalacturonan lyase n=1 Tax=Micromonospora sp. NPDC050417 TaxID=3364280 RepID=UPI00378AF69E
MHNRIRRGHRLRRTVALLAALPLVATGLVAPSAAVADPGPGLRQLEFLDRGLVAVKVDGGVYLSWRFLGDEPDDVAYRVYRDNKLVATVTGSSNYTDAAGTATSAYRVAAIVNGVTRPKSAAVTPLSQQYQDIQLKQPPAAITPVLETYATTVSGKQYEPVNMDLLRHIREAHENPAGVTEAEFAALIAPFRTYFGDPSWAPKNPFGTRNTWKGGDRYGISDKLFAELDKAFTRYVDELDRGPKLAYAKNPDGTLRTNTATYSANDASVGDLDGDGSYELILKWDPSDSKDSSAYGFTAPAIIDAYKLDGTLLWRVNVGYNIRAGAHDTQLVVADFNGDGRSELIIKTADGTTTGKVLADGSYQVRDVVGNKQATADKIQSYIRSGDEAKLDKFTDAMNTYSVSWVLPGGNTPPEQNVRQWGKVYTYGPIGTSNEYLTAFDGATGRVLDTVDYAFPYGEPNWGAAPVDHRGAFFKAEIDPYWQNPETQWGYFPWGDPQGNRSNRFLAGVAYLDGVHPSAIMARGYYAKTTVAAYSMRGNKLVLGNTFDSDRLPDPKVGEERGVHSLMVADVDGDAKDEIVYGAMVLDDNLAIKTVANTWFPSPPPATNVDLTPQIKNPDQNAKFVYLAHGDAMHIGDLNPDRPGQEVFLVQEAWNAWQDAKDRAGNTVDGVRPGGGVYDPVTGELMTAFYAGKDNGRGAADNIDPNSPGAEYWSNGSVYSAVTGERLYGAGNLPQNFLIYWDGDLTRELLDSNRISKANTNYTTRPSTVNKTDLLVATDASSNNGSKSTPTLTADLFGDWREELVLRVGNDKLRLYTTTIPTEHKIRTLMHDPQYRNQVACENITYNQPPHPSFYLDPAYPLPARRTDIDVAKK